MAVQNNIKAPTATAPKVNLGGSNAILERDYTQEQTAQQTPTTKPPVNNATSILNRDYSQEQTKSPGVEGTDYNQEVTAQQARGVTTKPSVANNTYSNNTANQANNNIISQEENAGGTVEGGNIQGNVFKEVTAGNNNSPVENSWTKEGKEKANLQYGSDVLTAKQNAQQNAVTLKQQMNQYQEQADMSQYQNNQSAEKVGWTGGYVLDQNRQLDYLKASLSAQMYGAIELQKYGYDTSLAAARLSYDLNQKEYARQYYQDAVNNALNEAQVTGIYVSAEIKDMLDQREVAKQILSESGYTFNPETGTYTNAAGEEPIDSPDYQLVKTINDWFSANGITSAGQETLARIQADNNQNLAWHTQLWTEYQAAIQAAKADIDDNPTKFVAYTADDKIDYTTTKVNEDGSVTGGEVRIIDMSTMTEQELKDYYNIGNKTKEQVIAYLNWEANNIVANNTTTDKDNNQTMSETNREKTQQELNNLVQRANSISSDIDLSVEGFDTTTGKYQNTKLAAEFKPAVINDDGTIIEGTPYTEASFTKYNSVFSGTGDDIKISVNNKEYSLTCVWSNYVSVNKNCGYDKDQLRDISKRLSTLYPTATDASIVYYDNRYFIYNNSKNAWGVIVKGEAQDKGSDDERAFAKAMQDLGVK